MKITRLRTNHLECPLGFDFTHVTLGYAVEGSSGRFAKAARIQVALQESAANCLLDTGLVPCVHDPATGRLLSGIDNLAYELDLPLKPRRRYFWRVFVRTDVGEEAWSDWTWLETAKQDEPWSASPIASPLGADVHPVFIKRFSAREGLVSARLHILGLGLYEASLNGGKLGREVLSPGFHTYDKCLHYQTLPLEPKPGSNTLSVMLGDGWYKGRYGLKASAPRYGTDYALLAELHLLYADGHEELICTDESWLVAPSPVLMDDIYDGETFDARLLDAPPEARAVPSPLNMALVAPRVAPLLRVQEKRAGTACPGCEGVIDFGQNMAGWVEFACDAPRGRTVTLRFAEEVRGGRLYLDNLRKAACTFTYVSDGTPRVVRPRFTYFGFRYLSVDGMDADPQRFTACVIHSDMERTGRLITSHPGLNRLLENVWWSQRSNFFDIPTDCPQRDERMGWTGDIQVFSDTACFQADCTAFLAKFMQDLRHDQQTLGGNVPCVTPMAGYTLAGVSAWGDAATVVPWQTYLHSGDKQILRDALPGMRDWVDFISDSCAHAQTGFLWTDSPQLGDWLALDGDSVYGGTDRGMLATAYYYYSAMLTARAARILEDARTAETYGALADRIKTAFRAEYFTASGRLAVQTQTACAVVTYLGLAPDAAAQKRVDALLRRKVIEAGVKLETGFVGTPWLLPALSDGGNAALAYDLLLREEYPGWLYEVGLGATTIWERWNSVEPDGSMNRDGMNSFNHYAYGSVAAWMYRCMCGIAPDPAAPGFRHIEMSPKPDRRLASATASLMTGSGLCELSWVWENEACRLQVTIPFGCTASLTVPGESEPRELQAGTYTFRATPALEEPTGLDTPWRGLLEAPQTRAVVERLFPRALRGIAFQNEMHTMRQLTQSPFAELSREQVAELASALRQAQRRGR